VSREPEFRYEVEAAKSLHRLEQEASDRLWGRLCDAIDLIIDHPDSREARGEELRGREGKAVWKVDVFDGTDDWAILWHRDSSGVVVIAWIGSWPPV
jgi:hypothetical protein